MRYATMMVVLLTAVRGLMMADLPAFPGAEGFGSKTGGGRGGQVIFVTNTNPSGPGSLKSALETSGARIVVFRVSGTIDWTTVGGVVNVRNPYLTVAAQTAPGGGVDLRNGMISVATHDVIVRGLRFRVGDSQTGFAAGNRNGIEVIGPGNNVIFDHCSISWAVDENVGVTGGAHDVTIQYCYVTEGLNCSIHPEGCHSKGLMANHSAAGNFSFHHNVIADNVDRNPQMVSPGNLESVNNVIYNYGFGGKFDNNAKVNFVGNRYIQGPNTPSGRMGLIWGGGSGNTKVYVLGNVGPGRPTNAGNEWAITDAPAGYRSMSPLFTPNIIADNVDAIWPSLLDEAGAHPRDAVDERVRGNILAGTGSWINSETQVGGWPIMLTGAFSTDSDNDGMPDSWEISRGLNPHDPSDANLDLDQDGYLNIEEYVNGFFDVFGDNQTTYNGGDNYLPGSFVLQQNFPNPFNPATTIGYFLGENSYVTLTVYNMLGQPVKRLTNEARNAGYNETVWAGNNEAGSSVTSGVYFYRIEVITESGKPYAEQKRMILVK